jgi:uncharacterized membrane protein YcaP (DUF421 family)
VGDGFALLVTILAWSAALDWLGYHSPFFHRLLRTPPSRLVRDGRIVAAGLRHELMTRDELMAQLRNKGSKTSARSKVRGSSQTEASALYGVEAAAAQTGDR